VDSEVAYGYTIALWGDDILVGGKYGEVSHSDDGGETFTELEDVDYLADGYVTVAFDSYFDINDTIYAAVSGGPMSTTGGIYLWVIDESTEWYDLHADPIPCQLGLSDGTTPIDVAYTGIVLDRPSPGNPMTSPETGGVLYASYVGYYGDLFTGVARCLTPIVEICCDIGMAQWDYLWVGLTYPDELFCATPDALKICGCLSADSNSKLFAIDDWTESGYDMCEGQDGTVWTFEDCYAKKAVELTSPADGIVIPSDPCECDNIPFTIKWDRVCDACCYEVQFAMDEDFEEPVDITDWLEYYLYGDGIDGVNYCDIGIYCPVAPMTPSMWIPGMFTCEFTYYWRVRAAKAETGQYIHSWWSEPQSFTVAPSVVAAEITLVSPEPGATNLARANVAFSWSLLATADEFDWVLSKNADLSSPVSTKTGLETTACTYTGTALDYDTPYYWQVTAYNDGAAVSMSAIGTFRTVAKADEPGGGVTAPTPIWVWVVIAIGAVLVIVVIVLIFRTRRV
jgi:hypothetical protein